VCSAAAMASPPLIPEALLMAKEIIPIGRLA
jgi:hypothetical protein